MATATTQVTLHQLLKSPDSGLRYWGMVGCFLLDDQKGGPQGLPDDAHEVRAMAAWLLIRTDKKEQGFKALDALLKENSYATLKVLNILDWIGEDAQVLRPTIASLKVKNYEERMQEYLLQKFE